MTLRRRAAWKGGAMGPAHIGPENSMDTQRPHIPLMAIELPHLDLILDPIPRVHEIVTTREVSLPRLRPAAFPPTCFIYRFKRARCVDLRIDLWIGQAGSS